jgi:hypothetical protein
VIKTPVGPSEEEATSEHGASNLDDSKLPPVSVIDITKYETLLVLSVEQLKEGNKSMAAPIANFEIRHANKQIGVPTNYDKLINQSYLYLLILKVCSDQGYSLISTGKQHQPRFVTSKAIEASLKGFGVPILSREIPKCPDLKGYSKDGIMSCVNHIVQGKKGVRGDLFKCHTAKHIAQIVLGSVWAKDSPVEKNILDQLISYARKNVSDKHMFTYLVSPEKLSMLYGIKTNLHKSELFTAQEQRLCDLYLETLKLEDLKFEDDTPANEVSKAVETIYNAFQVKLKDYKVFTNAVVGKRLEACYEPYPKGKKRDAAKKMPIKQHLARVREENPQVLVPTDLIRGIIRISARPPSYECSYDEICNWYESLIGKMPDDVKSWASSPEISQTIITIWDEFGNCYSTWAAQSAE